MNDTDVNHNLFGIWQREVQNSFTERNYLALPISDLPNDCRVDARSMLTYMNRLEKDYHALFLSHEQTKNHLKMIEKRLSVIEKEQKFNNNNLLLQQNQIMEQNIAINRLTDTLSEFFEKDFGMKWKRNTGVNTILDREDLIVDNSEATNNQRKLPDWETVAQTLKICPIQNFIYEYMDNECEKVYEQLDAKDSKNRKQKCNFTTLYNMLITCLPDGVQCVCERPTVTEELIDWKHECQELSKKCA